MALPQALNWCFDMGAYCYFPFFFLAFPEGFLFCLFLLLLFSVLHME